MAKIKNGELVFLSTFALFTIEAMFHFNIGANGKEKTDGKFDFHLPKKEQLPQILLVVAAFAYINSVVVKKLS